MKIYRIFRTLKRSLLLMWSKTFSDFADSGDIISSAVLWSWQILHFSFSKPNLSARSSTACRKSCTETRVPDLEPSASSMSRGAFVACFCLFFSSISARRDRRKARAVPPWCDPDISSWLCAKRASAIVIILNLLSDVNENKI